MEIVTGFKDSMTRKRTGYKRAILWSCLAITLIHDLRGRTSTYLYTQKKFGWTEQEYTVYSSVFMLQGLLHALVILPVLSKKFDFHDSYLGIIGSLSIIAYEITVGKLKFSIQR